MASTYNTYNTYVKQEAEKLNNEGDDFFLVADFVKAVEMYTAALDRDFNVRGLLNRAEAYIKMKEWDQAYINANEALRLDVDNFLGFLLRGQARLDLGFEDEGVKDIEHAHKIQQAMKIQKAKEIVENEDIGKAKGAEKARKIDPKTIDMGKLLKKAKERAAQAKAKAEAKELAAAEAEIKHLTIDKAGDHKDKDGSTATGASTSQAKEEGGSAANSGDGAGENKGENAAGKSTGKKNENKKKSEGSKAQNN